MALERTGALGVEGPEILRAEPSLVGRDRRGRLVDRSLREPAGILEPDEVFALDPEISRDAL